VIALLLTGLISLSDARLGADRAEWEAAFGKPNEKGIYQWEFGRRGTLETIPKWENGRVVAISLRHADGHRLSNGLSRSLASKMRATGEWKSHEHDHDLSEDGMVLLIRLVFPEPQEKLVMTSLPKPVLGLTTSEWQEKFGKPDDEGIYLYDGYRIKPQLGLKNGRVSWIRIRKISGEQIAEAELQSLFTSLTGKPKEEFAPEKFVFDEGKTLIVTKGK